MSNIGYARVSGSGDDLAPQLGQLAKIKCLQVFQDQSSGAKAERPGLAAALSYMQKGDVLVVTKLDRLGKSLSHLVATVNALAARGIGFRSLAESIDTTASDGPSVADVFAALAEFDRGLVRERTRAGLAAVAAQGNQGGRKPVITQEKLRKAKALISEGITVREAAARIDVGKTALYDALRANNRPRNSRSDNDASIAAPTHRR